MYAPNPQAVASAMVAGTWLPGDAVELRSLLVRPCGQWVRVCHVSRIAWLVGPLVG
jgi:hypothetical protein